MCNGLLLCLYLILAGFSSELLIAGPGSGWGMSSRYNQMFDTKSVVEIEGTVEEVLYRSPLRGMSSGVHLRVKAKDKTYEVHLGPKWYIDNQEAKIEKGDQIKIAGSKIKFDGADAIIAESVTKGDQMLVLRDNSGRPNWAGWRNCCRP
ncbi:MAG: hypothetical protein R3B45_15630 [Bdellovibrionota bacterium]